MSDPTHTPDSGRDHPRGTRGADDPEPQGSAYRITIRGTLDDAWSPWFDGLRVIQGAGDTVLVGQVRDQAALHGLLAKIRDLGLTLLAIEPDAAGPAR